MKKKFLKRFFVLMCTFLFCFVTVNNVARATDPDTELILWGGDQGVTDEKIMKGMGLEAQDDPRVIAAKIIRILLTFMGIIMVSFIFYGGWKWMMSKGDSNEIQSAKDIIKNAVIGLAIVLMAFSIAQMIISALIDAGSNG